jgi:hypothetical protein
MHCFIRSIQAMSVSLVSFCPVHILPVMCNVPYNSSLDTAVRVVTTQSRLDCPEYDFRHGKLLFLFSEHPECPCGPSILLLCWSLGSLPRVKWLERALTTQNYILLKSEMSGATRLPPTYAFMTQTGKSSFLDNVRCFMGLCCLCEGKK